MKPYKLVFSPESRNDLDNIWWYIAEDSGEFEIADSFQRKLISYCFETLAYIPKTGAKQDDILNTKGIRMSPLENYNIFHRFNNEGEVLEIIRILRCSRDYKQLF